MIGPEDKRLEVNDFHGLYDRGSFDDVPPDHAQDSLNMRYTSTGHCSTRDGLLKSFQLPQTGIRRFFLLEGLPPNVGQPDTGDPGATDGSGLLHLDNSHNLRIGNDPTPIYSNGNMSDFTAINAGNRTYISPNNGKSGYQLGRIQVLNSFTGVSRDAAGLAPVGSISAANSATTGDVPQGVHQIAVIYETDTGFWTPPGPKSVISATAVPSTTHQDPTIFTATAHGMITGESHQISGGTGGATWANANDVWYITRIDDNHFSIPLDSSTFGSPGGSFTVYAAFTPASVDADGTHAIDVSSIPTGPSYVKKRLILATRADETEFFFVPNVPGSHSELNDNTTTTTTINFFDTDLVDSADYLFDVMEVIPSGSGMCKYRGRIILAGCFIPGNSERVFLSNINDPETFNFVSGYVQVQTERDGNNVTNCYVLRDTLYLAKFVGTFATEDNGGNPSTWAVSIIDAVVGAYAYGSSTFTVSQSAPDTGDIVLLASRSGLYLFDGVMRRPELTYKIQNLWLRINFVAFDRVTVAHDPWNHLIYITAPLDDELEPNAIMVGDYSDGRDFQSIRWDKWRFHRDAACVGMAYFGSLISPTEYTLKVGSLNSQYLYTLTAGQKSDDGEIIESYYSPGPFHFNNGGVNCFKMLNFRIPRGRGRFDIQLSGEDGFNQTQVPAPIQMVINPGREHQRGINFVNEKMTLKISCGKAVGDYMVLDRIDVWGLTLWPVRPQICPPQ